MRVEDEKIGLNGPLRRSKDDADAEVLGRDGSKKKSCEEEVDEV
jgi:hypothetical protein